MKQLAFIFFFLLLSTSLTAQTTKAAKTVSVDQKAIVATVQTLFDSMRAADTVKARSVMAPAFRVISLTQNAAGQTVTRESSGKQFLAQLISKPPQTLDERFWDGQVQIDGNLASYWCRYAFFLNGKFSHCGTDVFQLYRSPQGWQIINLAYNIRREGCDMKAIPAK
jgi:hypothetical protein